MFYKLLLIFTIVPLLELMLLIRIGQGIGLIPMILIVASTGAIGITIAKFQGLLVLDKIKKSSQRAEIPAQNIVEGFLLLVGAAMLLTPGIITDVTGFIFILPFTRPGVAKFARKILGKYFTTKSFFGGSFGFSNQQENNQEQKESKSRESETFQAEYTVEDEFDEEDEPDNGTLTGKSQDD